MPRDDTAERLRRLRESADFQWFLDLLRQRFEARRQALIQILTTDADLAEHNQSVGALKELSTLMHLTTLMEDQQET